LLLKALIIIFNFFDKRKNNMTYKILFNKKFYLALIIFIIAVYIGIKYNNKPKKIEPMTTNEITLIPREVIFGNPDKMQVSISHDGKFISYIAPSSNGVLNIYVAPRENIGNAKQVSNDIERGIRNYTWCYDNKHILYLQDIKGDENFQVHMVNIETNEDVNLTPISEVRNQIIKTSSKYPNKIIFSNNHRNKEYFDLFELDLEAKESKIIYTNNEYSSFIVDDELNLRFLIKPAEDGGRDIYELKNDKASIFLQVPKEDVTTTAILGFGPTNDIIYLADSLSSNTSKLVSINLQTQERTEIFHSEKTNISDIITKPVTKEIEAVVTEYEKTQIHHINGEIEKDFNFLLEQNPGEIIINSRTEADNFWIVIYLRDDFPHTYCLYDRTAKKLTKLFTNRANLEKYSLAPMQPVIIKSRDNLDLVSYLTLPVASLTDKKSMIPTSPVPLVLLVHGGPTVRDHWGLDMQHQWLANRGYAVLSVNYRGSDGFGKKFFQAGFGEWSAKMHDDLIDAVNWAIDNKIASKDKIAIMGGSYGGYATLVGLTFTPEVFVCGVDIVGPSNLFTLLKTIPPYWKSGKAFLINLTGGDPDTEEGKKILAAKSPLNFVDNITKPLLIGQGANDPRVKQSESDQIVKLMQEKNIPVTYILYPDEGHGFAKPDNKISFYAITEGFLAKYLGGLVEPYKKDNKTSMQIIAGENNIKGLISN
jgi:dipeptidyl aminopeptidase/acylaminoacyl peptidase